MRLQMMVVTALSVSICVLPELGPPRRCGAQEAESLVRQLRDVTHPQGDRLELEEIDYQQLVERIPPVLRLSEKPPGLWRMFPSNGARVLSGNLYGVLWTAVATARLVAPTRQEKEKWLRTELDLVLRFLSDPQTQRIYAEKRDPDRHGSDFDVASTVRARDLQGVRYWLIHEGIVGNHDWGLYHGFFWTDQPGAVVVRDGVVFVEQRALKAAGVPLQAGPGTAAAVNGRRRASIPIAGERQAGRKRGFRDRSGRVYLPVEEFHRQGVFTVDVIKRSQMVEISLEPPSHSHQAGPP